MSESSGLAIPFAVSHHLDACRTAVGRPILSILEHLMEQIMITSNDVGHRSASRFTALAIALGGLLVLAHAAQAAAPAATGRATDVVAAGGVAEARHALVLRTTAAVDEESRALGRTRRAAGGAR